MRKESLRAKPKRQLGHGLADDELQRQWFPSWRSAVELLKPALGSSAKSGFLADLATGVAAVGHRGRLG